MPETLQTPVENENVERRIPDRHRLTPEIIGKFLKPFNEREDIVRYIDVLTIYGDIRRIARHPTNKFLLRIAYPNFTIDLDPSNPDIYREFFISDDTLAKINGGYTDEGID